jgi:putative endonuclease
VSRSRRRLGELGERLAAAHLEAKGYRIVDRNYRRREGEVDLVAEGGGVVTFVEVRTRMGGEVGEAAGSITPAKAARLVALAEAYCQEYAGRLANSRIDVVAVELWPDGRLRRIEHIENAVEG